MGATEGAKVTKRPNVRKFFTEKKNPHTFYESAYLLKAVCVSFFSSIDQPEGRFHLWQLICDLLKISGHK